MDGYVYILVNSGMPNLIKAGYTTTSPEERAKELSKATGVPYPFVVAYSVAVHDCERLERLYFNALTEKNYRPHANREFFTITSTEAIEILNDTILSNNIQRTNIPSENQNGLKTSCSGCGTEVIFKLLDNVSDGERSYTKFQCPSCGYTKLVPVPRTSFDKKISKEKKTKSYYDYVLPG